MSAHKEAQWQPPNVVMDTSTNYNIQYTSKTPPERAQPIKPADRKRIDAKFDGDTTYGQDFRKWPSDKRSLIRTSDKYQMSDVPFEGLSTYKGHYLPQSGGPAHSFKPDGLVYKSDAPFESSTLYRTEFTQKELISRPTFLKRHKPDTILPGQDKHELLAQ